MDYFILYLKNSSVKTIVIETDLETLITKKNTSGYVFFVDNIVFT